MSLTGRFSRSDRLLDSRDFRRVSRQGRRTSSRHFVVLRAQPHVRATASQDESERVRLGITVSRKVGNAVVRNYIKRSVREWFRSRRGAEPASDMVVIARRDAKDLCAREVALALDSLVRSGTR